MYIHELKKRKTSVIKDSPALLIEEEAARKKETKILRTIYISKSQSLKFQLFLIFLDPLAII